MRPVAFFIIGLLIAFVVILGPFIVQWVLVVRALSEGV